VNGLSRLAVRAVDVVNRKGKAVGVRLVRLTGKRGYAIHPKHLVDHPWHDWYLPHLRADDYVLDVGCANGAHLARAATRCRSIVGFDYDLAQLPNAARAIRDGGLVNARIFAWDITGAFPFPEGTFSAALFLDVIEHIHPRVAVLKEIARVLRDDGRLLVSGPNRDTRWRRTLRAAGLFRLLGSRPQDRVHARGVSRRAGGRGLRAGLRGGAGGARHPLGRRHRCGGWAVP
jgi:SAM-dependent methyltransferase